MRPINVCEGVYNCSIAGVSPGSTHFHRALHRTSGCPWNTAPTDRLLQHSCIQYDLPAVEPVTSRRKNSSPLLARLKKRLKLITLIGSNIRRSVDYKSVVERNSNGWHNGQRNRENKFSFANKYIFLKNSSFERLQIRVSACSKQKVTQKDNHQRQS